MQLFMNSHNINMKKKIIDSYSKIINQIEYYYSLKGEDYPSRFSDLMEMLALLEDSDLNSIADLTRMKKRGLLGFIGGKYLGRGEVFSDLERAGCLEKSDLHEFYQCHRFLIDKMSNID